ncbi:MAG: hypothetical protein ACPGJI_03665 [Kangiellaceae bacterium]
MKKNYVRNLVLRTLVYVFILTALPYSYFLWHAKQGIDAFLVTRDFDFKIDYSWLWINYDGEIYLEKVRVSKTRKKPIIQAPRVKVSLPSIFDLLDSKEQVVYKTYPNPISLSVVNASSATPDLALNIFGIKYKKEHLNLFFPEICREQNKVKLPEFFFDFSTTFKIEQTADVALVSFKFRDTQFATIKGNFNINRLFETGVNTAYLSDLKINMAQLAWAQQSTQKCLDELKLGRNKLTIFYNDFLDKKATEHKLILDKDAMTTISDFFYRPQSVDLEVNIEEGTTYSQINYYPIHDFQERAGVSIKLNDKLIDNLFIGQIEPLRDESEEPVSENSSQNGITLEPPKPKTTFISKRKQTLTNYLGSKIKINLYNGSGHIGYLESIGKDQMFLKKLEHRGKSILPFSYIDIKSIEVLVAQN